MSADEVPGCAAARGVLFRALRLRTRDRCAHGCSQAAASKRVDLHQVPLCHGTGMARAACYGSPRTTSFFVRRLQGTLSGGCLRTRCTFCVAFDAAAAEDAIYFETCLDVPLPAVLRDVQERATPRELLELLWSLSHIFLWV